MANRKAKVHPSNAGQSSGRRLRRARNAVARRSALRSECSCASVAVPRPLVVASQGQLGIAIISGEFFGPFVPPLYGPCMVEPDGSFAALDFDMFTPFAADLREVLWFCFSPNFAVDALLSVCDLLPGDLSAASPWDVGAFDLGLRLDGSLTVEQCAALSQARALCEAGSGGSADGQRIQ